VLFLNQADTWGALLPAYEVNGQATTLEAIASGSVSLAQSLPGSSFSLDLTDPDDASLVGRFGIGMSDRSSQPELWVIDENGGDPVRIRRFKDDGSAQSLSIITAVKTDSETLLPTSLALRGNYPNPVHGQTTLVVDIPSSGDLALEIVDILGRRVHNHILVGVRAGQSHQIRIDASSWAAGMYAYSIVLNSEGGTERATGTMVVLK